MTAENRDSLAECLRADGVDATRVEKVFLVPGAGTLTMTRHRTGAGWSARRYRNGRIAWEPLPVSQELAES
jgi:hypothetical protein